MSKKLTVASILMFFSLAATLASSIFSTATQAIEAEFHMGQEVVTLCTSLFVLGYAIGPMIFGPMSELYGRHFAGRCGRIRLRHIQYWRLRTAANFQTLIICRFVCFLVDTLSNGSDMVQILFRALWLRTIGIDRCCFRRHLRQQGT